MKGPGTCYVCLLAAAQLFSGETYLTCRFLTTRNLRDARPVQPEFTRKQQVSANSCYVWEVLIDETSQSSFFSRFNVITAQEHCVPADQTIFIPFYTPPPTPFRDLLSKTCGGKIGFPLIKHSHILRVQKLHSHCVPLAECGSNDT